MKNWTLALALGTAVVNTAIGLGVNPVSAAIWDVSFTIADPNDPEYFKGLLITENTLTTVSTTTGPSFTGYHIIDIVNGTQGANPMAGNPAVSLLPIGEVFPPPRATFTNDNLFNPAYIVPANNIGAFSSDGLAYKEVGGDEDGYNLFYVGGTQYNGLPYDRDPVGPGPEPILNIEDFRATLVPEPSSLLGFLALGTLGAASTLKRKLKSSKSTGKETTKVG